MKKIVIMVITLMMIGPTRNCFKSRDLNEDPTGEKIMMGNWSLFLLGMKSESKVLSKN